MNSLRPLIAGLTLLLAAAPRAVAQARSLDDLVLAIVNGEEITRRQVVARLLDYNGDDALQRMVSRLVVQQAAKKANLSVSEGETNKKLDEIRAQFKTEEDFRKVLAQSRLTEKQYADEVRFTQLLEKVALKEKPITDEDLRQYEVRLAVAKDKTTAEKWVKELNEGGDFADIARARSEDPATRKAAGRMRPFLKVELVDLWKAIDGQKLQPGAYTKTPFQLPNGNWGILKLERIDPVSEVSAAERNRLVTLVTREHMDDWLSEVRAKAAVKTFPLSQGAVAIVNGEPITRDQLIVRLLQFQGEETLDLMINRALLLQAAKRLNVTVTDAEADKKLAELRAAYKKPEEFQAFLAGSNMSERVFRDQVKYTLLMDKVALKEAPVTDADLVRYEVRMLIAPTRDTAVKWIKELDGGADFTKMVEERSADPDGRESGGKVPPFLKIELLEVWRALQEQQVKPGAYTRTPVLLTDSSWAIIKFEAVQEPSALKPEERRRLTEQVKGFRVSQWLAQTLTSAKAGGKISRPVPLSSAVIGK